MDATRVVDLKLEPELGLKWRTNGIGLPGYAVGRFSLKGEGGALEALRRAGASARRPTPPR